MQVSATRDAHTADDVLRRLRAKGYDAYIVKARRDGAMFYRVRVGHYPSMEHASQMVSRLLDGDYPKVASIFPTQDGSHAKSLRTSGS